LTARGRQPGTLRRAHCAGSGALSNADRGHFDKQQKSGSSSSFSVTYSCNQPGMPNLFFALFGRARSEEDISILWRTVFLYAKDRVAA
jgi:hypothetical protein